MNDFYETCRDINRWLAAAVFLWLVFRTVRAWPAEWAKPNHVWHYRCLLIAGSGFMLLISYGAYVHARAQSIPTVTSAAATAMCLFIAGICTFWPKPYSMRKDQG